jgi:NTP pyrophosphatase (non-canonical NTP hydrolase)
MKYSEYVKATRRTWNEKEDVLDNINHATLGLFDEAGELAKQYKSNLAYDTPLDVTNVKEELGDLMYFIARLTEELKFKNKDSLQEKLQKIITDKPEYEGKPSQLDMVFSIATRAGGVYAGLVTNDGPAIVRSIMDLMFNIKIFSVILDTDLSKIMEANIEKLKKRFPEKFETEEALNRDVESESEAIKETLDDARDTDK